MLALRQGIRHMQTTLFVLLENMKNEEMIERTQEIDTDI